MFGHRPRVVVSRHIIVDRQHRLGKPTTANELEALISRYGAVSRKRPEDVHNGKGKADAWCTLDTGRRRLVFPLVRKQSRGRETVYLATTVLDRESELDGFARTWRRFRTR